MMKYWFHVGLWAMTFCSSCMLIGCKNKSVNILHSTDAQTTFDITQPELVVSRDTIFKKSISDNSALVENDNNCFLKQGTTIQAEKFESMGRYVYVKNAHFSICSERNGYVSVEDIILSVCDHSWEEKPGYVDYTTAQWLEFADTTSQLDPKLTLTGCGNFGICPEPFNHKLHFDSCQKRYSFLKKCFVKSLMIATDKNSSSTQFLVWAKDNNIRLVPLLSAIAQVQSGLGRWQPECKVNGCKNEGLMGVHAKFGDGSIHATKLNILSNIGAALQYYAKLVVDRPSFHQFVERIVDTSEQNNVVYAYKRFAECDFLD